MFCANIVQLKFNAWHFIDQDLWASLASEIFEGLSQSLSKDAALLRGEPSPEQVRAHLIAATDSTKNVLNEKKQQKAQVQAELDENQTRIESLTKNAEQIEKSLDSKSVLSAAIRSLVKK